MIKMISGHSPRETGASGFVCSIANNHLENNSDSRITSSFCSIKLGIIFLFFLLQLFFAATASALSPGTTSSPGPTMSSTTVTLSWGESSGATYYGVGVRDMATNTLVVSTTVTDTFYTAYLSAGKPYRWNVNACNSASCSDYTDPLYFQTPGSEPETPTVSSVSPSTIAQGTSYQNVTVYGSNFTSSSYHQFSIDNGSSWFNASNAPTINGSTSMTVAVSNIYERTVLIRVCASQGSNCSSENVAVTIQAAAPETPTVSSVSPSTIAQGTSYQNVTVYGSNFTSSSYHQFSIDNGSSWFNASNAPTINGSTSMTVAVSNIYERIVLIRVCASQGSNCSSENVAVTIQAASSTLPASPTGLVALASNGVISLAWNDNSNNESGFRIERKVGTSGSWLQVATTGQNSAAYLDYGVTAGTTYYYRAYAYNTSGNSGYSNEATATLVTLVVNGISSSYSTTTMPYQPVMNLTGSGFNSVTQISWSCTMPDGATCAGSPYIWSPADPVKWAKFSVTSDTVASVLPTFLDVGDPTGTYNWSVTFSDNGVNPVTKSFTVVYAATETQPDLVPQSVTLSASSVAVGGTLTVSWTIANQGSGSAGSSTTGLRLNTSPVTTSRESDIFLTNVSTPSISSNSSTMQSQTITIPAGTAAGTYYIWVIADNVENSTLNQSDISNDYTRSAAFTVNTYCEPPTSTPIPLSLSNEVTNCISSGLKQVYSFSTQLGQNYSAVLTPVSGDPDLYLASSQSCIDQAPATQSCLNNSLNPDLVEDSITITATSSGTYYVAVYGSNDSSYSLRVDSEPLASIDSNNNAPVSGELVTFDGIDSKGSSSTCGIDSYLWEFGDGTFGSDVNVGHDFNGSSGTSFTVRLTVEDCLGQTDTATMNVTISGQTNGIETDSSYSDDPVNLATGNFTYERADLRIPGIGIPFEFKRFYNSKEPQKPDSSDVPMGYGWGHSYNIQLTSNAGNIVIIFGDGNQETYSDNGDGTYSSDPGIYNTLTNNGDGTFTLATKQLLEYNFDEQGRLTSIADKNGNALTVIYDASGNLDSITDTAGRLIDFAYDGSNRLTQITDPIGRTVIFGYDANGDLTSVIDPNNGMTQYAYDADNQILNIIDPRGNMLVSNVYDNQRRVVESQQDALDNQTAFEYDFETRVTTVTDALGNKAYHYHDENLRIISIKDSQGNIQNFAYDENNNRTQVTNNNGYPTQYSYDVNSNVTTKTDTLGNVTAITYDTSNNPLTRTDALGNTTTFTYDVNGNLLTTTDALTNTTTVTYDASGQPLTITDARSNTTTNTYNAEGNLIQIEDALGNITQYTYDGVGRRLTKVDALDRTTTYTFDSNDNLLSVTDPVGNISSSTYDGNNNKLTVTDKNGNLTQLAYDVKDLLSTTTDSLSGVVTNSYNAIGRRTAVQDRNDNITRSSYDAVGNLVQVTDAIDNASQFTYDANSNRLSITDPNGNTSLTTYDALNRRVSVQDALGNTTTTAYDELGRTISMTNAKGQTTAFSYDNLGRRIQVTDADGGTVQNAYDENGNRISMTDPNGNITTYVYNALNRLTTKVESLGNNTQYQYDAVGNRIQVIKPDGDIVQYVYDNLDRLTIVTYPDASTVSLSYDDNGNRTQMVDSLGTQTYAYDALNRRTAHTDPFGNTVGYGYDASGNRTSLVYPDTKTVTYAYDALNRLTNVTDWLTNTTTYSYDTAGRLTSTTNPNGTTATYGYDNADRLTSLINAKADTSVISSYSYTLDAIGNHTGEERDEPLMPVFIPGTVAYTYDAENRLTDANGMLNSFDANGNMQAKGTDSYVYDYENRLTQTTINTATTQYQYDGLGDRYTRITGGTTTRFILDTNTSLTNVLAETDASNNITAYNVYGLGLISRIQLDGTASYYHYDSRGSTIALTDVSGVTTDTYAYDPFGKSANRTGSTANPFTYIGRHGVIDEGDDLFYIRARYYDSDQQRFVSKDAKVGNDRDGQSLNRYIYAVNNPVVLIDISGYSPQSGSSDKTPFNSYLIEEKPSVIADSKGGCSRWNIWNYDGCNVYEIERRMIWIDAGIEISTAFEKAGNSATAFLTGNWTGFAKGLGEQTLQAFRVFGLDENLPSNFLDLPGYYSGSEKVQEIADIVGLVSSLKGLAGSTEGFRNIGKYESFKNLNKLVPTIDAVNNSADFLGSLLSSPR